MSTSWPSGAIVDDDPRLRTVRFEKPKEVSVLERSFAVGLRAAERLDREGRAITATSLRESSDRGLSQRDANELIGSARFHGALAARGIEMTVSAHGLTAEQEAALAIYLDTSLPATHQERLRMIGVKEPRWRGWLRNPAFAARMGTLAEDILRDSAPVALQKVAEATQSGERWAVLLTLEMTGRHDRRQNGFDPQALLMKVFQILDDSGVSQEVLAEIAGKIRSELSSGQLGSPVAQVQQTALEVAS